MGFGKRAETRVYADRGTKIAAFNGNLSKSEVRWRELMIAEMSLHGVARRMSECVRVPMLFGRGRFLDDPRHHVHNPGLLNWLSRRG